MKRFWKWYEQHELVATGIAAILFGLQIAHLYWLTTTVVAVRLFDKSFFQPSGLLETAILIVDYLEIPAILATSLVYINSFRINKKYKDILFLLFINSQWIHIFWITDEFVIEHFTGHTGSSILPLWGAWIAIAIDYLELPVIFDTVIRFYRLLKKGKIKQAFEVIKEAD